MGELYGEYNALTQEWRDGLASTKPLEDQRTAVSVDRISSKFGHGGGGTRGGELRDQRHRLLPATVPAQG